MNRGTVCDCDIDLYAFGHELECRNFGPVRRLVAGEPPPRRTHELVAGRWVRIERTAPESATTPPAVLYSALDITTAARHSQALSDAHSPAQAQLEGTPR